VTAPTVKSDEESQIEAAANKVADEVQTPTSASVSNITDTSAEINVDDSKTE